MLEDRATRLRNRLERWSDRKSVKSNKGNNIHSCIWGRITPGNSTGWISCLERTFVGKDTMVLVAKELNRSSVMASCKLGC